MGPDEFATREELGIVVKFALARIQQQSEMISMLSAILIAKGIVTEPELQELMADVKASPNSVRAQRSLESLRELAAIRNILRQYEDPQE